MFCKKKSGRFGLGFPSISCRHYLEGDKHFQTGAEKRKKKKPRLALAKHTTADRGWDGNRRRGDARDLYKSTRSALKARERCLSTYVHRCVLPNGNLCWRFPGLSFVDLIAAIAPRFLPSRMCCPRHVVHEYITCRDHVSRGMATDGQPGVSAC